MKMMMGSDRRRAKMRQGISKAGERRKEEGTELTERGERSFLPFHAFIPLRL
jgi:hypothetical protein